MDQYFSHSHQVKIIAKITVSLKSLKESGPLSCWKAFNVKYPNRKC